MARETKVGVLAGLAFIICFAVILANRGTQQTFPTLAYLNQSGVNQSGQSPLGGSGQSTGAVAQPFVQPGFPVNPSAQRVDRDGAFVPRFDPAVNYVPALPLQQGYADARLASDSRSQVDHSVNIPAAFVNDPRLTVHGAPVQQPTASDVPQPLGSPLTNGGTNWQPVNEVQPSGNPIANGGVKHVVAPGETLSKLVATYYGRKSNTAVQAVFDANRARMTSPDAIRPGIELVLPEVPGIGSPQVRKGDTPINAHPVVDSRTVRAETPKVYSKKKDVRVVGGKSKNDAPTERSAKSEAPPRVYQVRKNDRLMNIAREQLGDASRWKEIYDLNKDKFPDAGKIREGVRIKLPGPMRSS